MCSMQSSYEFREYCETCNSGYYWNDEIDSKKCEPCSSANISIYLISFWNYCHKCEFISNELTCTSCKEAYTLINGTCFKSCDTNCLRCLYYGEDNRDCIECKKTYYLKLNSTLKDTQYFNEYYCSKCPDINNKTKCYPCELDV